MKKTVFGGYFLPLWSQIHKEIDRGVEAGMTIKIPGWNWEFSSLHHRQHGLVLVQRAPY